MNQSLLNSRDLKYKSCSIALEQKSTYDLLEAKTKHKPALTFPDG